MSGTITNRWPHWSLWLVLAMLQWVVCVFPGAAQAQTYGPPYSLDDLSAFGTGNQSPGPYANLPDALQAAKNVLTAEYGTSVAPCFAESTIFGFHSAPYVARQAYGGNNGDCFINHDAVLIVGTPLLYDIGKNTGGCNCNSGNGGAGGGSSPKRSSGDSAQDSEGGSSGTPMAGDPINTATGNKYEQDTDYRGSSWLIFRRFYNSGAGVVGAVAQTSLGPQWRHSFDRSLSILLSGANGSDSSLIVLYRPDGSSEQFIKDNGVWQADADVADRLVEQDDASGNPIGYSVFMAAVREHEQYSVTGQLQSITNQAGQIELLTYSSSSTSPSVAPAANLLLAVTDPNGRQLNFSYNSNGTLAQVSLPDGGALLYGYDAATGNLTSVQFPDGKILRYVYNEASLNSGTSQPAALTGVIDESGVRFASTGYNSKGQAISSSFAGGADAMTVVYSGLAGTATTTMPLGLSVQFQAMTDSYGSFRSAFSSAPCGSQCSQPWRSISYDSHGYPSSKTDFNGTITRTTYDSAGLLDTEVDAFNTPSQRTINTTWDSNLRLPLTRKIVNAAGAVVAQSAWVYNSRGQILARCEMDPGVPAAASYTCSNTGSVPVGVRRTVMTYCDAVDTTQCPVIGLLLTKMGPRTDVDDTTRYSYYMDDNPLHHHGDLAEIRDALNHPITFISYDGAGRPHILADKNGIIQTLTYTPRGWLASSSIGSPAKATMSYTYTPYGAVQTVTDPDGVVTSYAYDDAHRLNKITDAQGNYVQFTLDASGNRIAENIYASGAAAPVHGLARQFNQLGQLVKVIDGLNHTLFDATASGSYDPQGDLVQSIDGLGIQQKTVVDALNRVTSRVQDVNGTNATTQNTTNGAVYDALDRVTGITDPSGLITGYAYDGLGNRTSLQSPDTGTSNDTFDAAGNRLTHTDAKGIVSTNTYDALGRVLTTTFADSSLNVAYYYDEGPFTTGCQNAFTVGHLTRVVENNVTTIFCYDELGRMVKKSQIQGSQTDVTAYAYSPAGRLIQVTYPSGTVVTYIRNSLGQVSTITATPAGAASRTVVSNVVYMPFGPVASYVLGNGQLVTRNYDANYRLSDLSSPNFNVHLARDVMGNVTALGGAPGVSTPLETYTYDRLYRLTGVLDGQGNPLESYTYNGTGDRLSKASIGGLATGAYGYPTGSHQLTSIGNSARSYDLNGSTTGVASGGQTFGYGYDGRGRLTIVQANQQTVATYGYNIFGQRTSEVVTSPQTGSLRFSYDQAGQVQGEYGTQSRDYIWMDGVLVAAVDNQGTSPGINFIVVDDVGTPRSIANATGSEIWHWAYKSNPFGEKVPVSTVGYTFNLRFPGQYYDVGTGLHYNGARYYESAIGRYVQSDPMGMLGGQSSTYAYVDNGPLARIDPLGLRSPTPGEVAMLSPIFNNTVDFSKVDIISGGGIDPRAWAPIATGNAVTLGNTIHFPSSGYQSDFSSAALSDQAWLAHEMTHVYQYQNDPSYSWAKAAKEGLRSDTYKYSLSEHSCFKDYRYEQQAAIVAGYYAALQRSWVPALIDYEDLMNPVGLGINHSNPPPILFMGDR